MYRHLIFDLDGTLIDTIEDIAFAINLALEKCGYPQRYDRQSTKALIGDGAEMLVRRALKEKGQDLQAFSELLPIYMELYRQHNLDKAPPFPDLKEALSTLKKKGIKISCVTNKPHPLAVEVLRTRYGEGFFDCVIGASKDYPVKPNPASTLDCIAQVGVPQEECLYIGDSHVDIDTGHNAGLPVALCLWGYEVDYEKILSRADLLLREPKDLLNLE